MPVRGLVPRLPRQTWLILSGDAVSALGTGMTLPFFLIYLHRMRDIDLAVAGPIFSMIAVAGLVGNPLGGLLADRFGAKQTTVSGLVIVSAGTAGLAVIQSAWQGFLAAGVYGLGIAITAPAFQSLLGGSVPAELRAQAFAVRQAAINVGSSVGGLVSAFVVSFSSLRSFVILYLLDAATFLIFAALIGRFTRNPSQPQKTSITAVAGGYREVVSNRLLRRIWILVVAVVVCGFAAYYTAYPIYATEVGGLDAGALRFTFIAQTCTIVVAQLFVLRLMTGRRRTRGFALCAVLMAAAWVTVLATPLLGDGGLVLAGFTIALMLFAVGDAFLAPTVPPIINDLATDSNRGRYNGAYTLAWTSGYVIGPGLAGMVLGAGHGSVYFVVLVGALALVAVQAIRLERLLPPSVNGVFSEAAGTETAAATETIGAAQGRGSHDG
ncbi:MFS transporter [Streptosporangium sp. NPDC049644]|uniref:MFS transporter n=1 Tax=Streptosporangium sp. NPDC049644 TaxID=3155507 RepID=UPI003417A77C